MTLDQITNASGLEGRNALRGYITGHSGWSRLRVDNGLDLGTLTMTGLKFCATALNLGHGLTDHQRELLHNASPKDAPKVNDIPPAAPKPVILDAMELPLASPTENDAAALARIIQTIASQGQPKTAPIDAAQVKSIVDEAVKAAIADAVNVVRVEIKNGDKVQVKDLGSVHKSFPQVLKAASARHPVKGTPLPIWLGGPAGAGKTSIAENLSTALGVPYYHVKSMLFVQDLLGYFALGVWNATPFTEAYAKGGVVILDEIDTGANEALLALKGCFANGHIMLQTGPNGALERVNRHKDCYIIAAGNTWGMGATADYIGRNKIDAAFLDEFIKVDVAYDERFERSISTNVDWAIRVQKVRATAKTKGLKVIISPRATLHGAGLIAAGFSEDEAANMTYLAGLTPDQIKMLEA